MVWGEPKFPPLIKEVMNLLSEIRSNEKWLKLKQESPEIALAFIKSIAEDLPWQMKNLEYYKQMKRLEGHTEMIVGGGKETAVMPLVYKQWMQFICPDDVPSKVFMKEFIKKHPELSL